MDWDNVLQTSAQKPPPRKGRRAGLGLGSAREDDKYSSLDDTLENAGFDNSPDSPQGYGESNQPVPPPRARRGGGWADEAIKSGKKRGDSSNLLERQRFQSPDRVKKGYDSDEDIPLIPELDDYGDEDIKPRVSHAASVAMNRVATYKELDAADESYLKLDDIDLSLLAHGLDIEDETNVDEDTVLTWDQLFTDVTSELRSETEVKDLTSMVEA